MAREIGRQYRSDVLLHDLICFLDSIAERREEYTSEDIRQQRVCAAAKLSRTGTRAIV